MCEIRGESIGLDLKGVLVPNKPQPKEGIKINHGKMLVRRPKIEPSNR